MPHLAARAAPRPCRRGGGARPGRRGSRAQPSASSPIRLRISTRGPVSAGRAERQAADRADMVLELRGERALDRPVAAIVDARRHLVEQRPRPASRRIRAPARRHSRARRPPRRASASASAICASRPGRPARSSARRMPPSWTLRGAAQATDLAVRGRGTAGSRIRPRSGRRPRGSEGAPPTACQAASASPAAAIRAWPLPS